MKHSCGVDGTKRVKGAEAACRFGVVRKDAVVQGPVHVPTYVSALSRAAPHVPRVPHGPQLGGELAREGRHMVDQRATERIHQGRFVQLAREPVKRHRRRRCRLGFVLFGTRLRLHGKRLADHCQRPEDGIHDEKGKHADRNDLHDPAGSCSLWVRRAKGVSRNSPTNPGWFVNRFSVNHFCKLSSHRISSHARVVVAPAHAIPIARQP